jgi:hypothetical protein
VRRRSRRHGGGLGGAGTCSMDLAAVGEAPTVDPAGDRGGSPRGIGGGPESGR